MVATDLGILDRWCLSDAVWWEPDWDEYRNLAVKCVWALGAIGTPDARAVVRDAARCEAIKVREAAEHELMRANG